MRPLHLAATGLLAATLLTAPTAQAAAETCQGRAATVVGSADVVNGTEGDDVIVTNGATRVRALGGNDVVCVTGGPESGSVRQDIDLGSGDDRLLVERAADVGGPGSSYAGGTGRNSIALWAGRRLDLDLASGRLVATRSGRDVTATLRGFDSTYVVAQDLVVRGTAKADDLRFQACTATVRGRGGADVVAQNIYGTTFPTRLRCERREFRLFGAGGDDYLGGSTGRDLLVGGPGRDTISGNAGRDTCSGEKLRSCEIKRR
jgi:Ca2+-binding RTX toxin-like protein